MLPSPAELRYFIEVANTLNISRASERLGISQPTLSLAIKRLETSFGMPLLVRGKTGVKLTQGGQKLITHARLMIEDWEKLKGDALRADSEISGRYTIGCHPSVALYSLPHFLPRLMKDNPSLDIKIVHDLSRKITEDVISFKADFGIVVNPVEHPDLVIKLLCKDEVTLWSRAGEDVPPILLCDPDLLQTQALLKQISKHGLHFDRVVTSSSLEVVTALVAEGAGVGVLPTRVALRVKAMGLKHHAKNIPKQQDQICLIYRADAQKSFAGRAIAKVIEKSMQNH
jgi:DNA-binding transcriptional LysR family regulator